MLKRGERGEERSISWEVIVSVTVEMYVNKGYNSES
jgi:hypothetical protein